MIGTELEDGSVVGRTLLGVLSGGIGCGNPKNKNIPKWWMRVSNDINNYIFLVLTPFSPVLMCAPAFFVFRF